MEWYEMGHLDLENRDEATGHTVMVFEDKWMALIPSPSS